MGQGLRQSPADIAIPDLPAWVIQGLVRSAWREIGLVKTSHEGTARAGVSAAGNPGPMDLLRPPLQRKLLELFSEKWPYRAPPGMSIGQLEELGGKGHYDVIRRLGPSLAKGIGDFETMELFSSTKPLGWDERLGR